MNPQNTTDHVNNNVKQEIFISYLDAINYISHNRILCNNIPQIDESIWENVRFHLWDEDENAIEIFQYFITDFNLGDVEFLEKRFPSLKFTYSDKLFRNRKEYSIAARLNTDTLSPSIWMELDDMAELPEHIEEYQVHVLDKEECNRSILANSSIKIEEVWPQDASHAVVVRILVNEEE